MESIPEVGTERERAEEDTEREDKVCPQAMWGDIPDPGPLLQSPDKLHYQKQVQENKHAGSYRTGWVNTDTMLFIARDQV